MSVVPEDVWESHHQLIESLYLHENTTLTDVVEALRDLPGLGHATYAQQIGRVVEITDIFLQLGNEWSELVSIDGSSRENTNGIPQLEILVSTVQDDAKINIQARPTLSFCL